MANYYTNASTTSITHSSSSGNTTNMNEARYDDAGGGDDESDVSMMDSDSDEDMDDSKIHVNPAQTNPQVKEIGSSIPKAQYSLDGASNRTHHPSHTKEQDMMDTTDMEISKRPRLDDGHQIFRENDGRLLSNRSLLPVEIWHHIFTFTPPRTLGRLLQVNKIFNACLDSSSLVIPHRSTYLPISAAKVLEPKTIWQASRKLYRPSMPAPLAELSDLDMWRLACSNSCQFCGKVGPSGTLGSDVWHSGPGEQGVHPIWPFSIHTCGNCLREKSVKEIDLLLSSSIPSPLMAALPFVFLTNELHVVPPIALEGGAPPSSIQITKYFLKSHVDEIKREFFGVKSLGNGTAEEWLKGLEERGRKRRNDAARWERWQSSGGIARMRTTEPSERPSIRSFPRNINLPEKPIAPQPTQSQTSPHSNTAHYMPATTLNNHGYPQSYAQPVQNAYVPPRFDSPSQTVFGHPPPGMPQFRQPRTKEEVAELKAARKAEIERRCMLLDPPIPPNVLAHIPSFQAALQIIKPVDNNAWELLVPRLLAQRAEAESRENDRIAQTRVVQEQFDDRRYQDTQAKDAKDVVEKEWEYVQTPIRNRLGEFADEIIREGWASGHKVTNDTSPRFAAEVLIYVRRRFYAEVEKEDEDDRATGKEPLVDPFDGPFTRKLTLENMKWVFDTKVRPLTEQYRKEIFLCNGCDSSKFYGFEGVVQHYAAKHTSDLSLGSIVVHWRSEWPEHPPFQADPGSAISEYQFDQSVGATYTHPSHGGYPVASAPHIVPPHVSQPYHHSPGSHYANPSNGDPYEGQYPQPYPSQPYNGPGTGYQQAYVDPHAGGYQQYPGSQHHVALPQNSGHVPQVFESHQAAPYPSSASPAQVQPPVNFDSQGISYPDAYGTQVSATYPSSGPPPPQLQPQPQLQGEAYQIQLEDVARSAKEAWSATAGIKDLPGSVRVATLLHNIVKQSRAKYPTDPPLTMLIDGLSNHKEMRQVRNINNLSCKTCSNLLANGQPLPVNPNKTSGLDKRTFSFPQLLNHFQSLHITTYQGDGPADWTRDMVELPELDRVGRLLHVNGMDDYKLQFIADAIPAAFPWPLPPVAQAKAHNATQMNKRGGGDGGQSWKSHRNQNKLLDRDPSTQYGYERHDNDITPEISGYHKRGSPNQIYDDRRRSPDSREVDEYGREIVRAPAHTYSGSYDNGTSLYGEKEELSLARQLELLEQKSRASNPQASSQTIPIGKGRPDVRQPSIPPRFDPPEGGSEDGEVRSSEPVLKPTNGRASVRRLSEVDRFRNDYVSGQSAEEAAKKAEEEERKQEEALRASWAAERVQTAKQMYQADGDQKPKREESPNAPSPVYRQRYTPQQPSPVVPPQSRPIRNDPPVSRQPRISAIDYAERYGPPAATAAHVRERSPELVDQRYKLNNSVYRHERQTSRGAQRTPSRYARYESVRLETERARSERARSRSPVYVKVGDAPGQYRERSPAPRAQHPEPLYHHRTSSAAQPHSSYERLPPRQEYYTMYDEEPQPQPQPRIRQPQIIEEPLYEYIQIADPNGDYIVRRAIRREAEPIYIQYPEDPYARQPIYEDRRPVYEERVSMYDERRPTYEGRQPIYADEGRQPIYAERQPIYERAPPQPQAPISRDDPAYFEEYDPSQPALPPSASGRMPRY